MYVGNSLKQVQNVKKMERVQFGMRANAEKLGVFLQRIRDAKILFLRRRTWHLPSRNRLMALRRNPTGAGSGSRFTMGSIGGGGGVSGIALIFSAASRAASAYFSETNGASAAMTASGLA